MLCYVMYAISVCMYIYITTHVCACIHCHTRPGASHGTHVALLIDHGAFSEPATLKFVKDMSMFGASNLSYCKIYSSIGRNVKAACLTCTVFTCTINFLVVTVKSVFHSCFFFFAIWYGPYSLG